MKTSTLTLIVPAMLAASPLPGAQPATDNTAINKRDQAQDSVTAMDQGNSPQDLEMTRKIRSEVMSARELGTLARNVKIITMNGKVILRGPVASQAEKDLIGAIAGRAAGSSSVSNELEIQTNP